MSRRPKRLKDWNLWVEVARTVAPLPRRTLPEPIAPDAPAIAPPERPVQKRPAPRPMVPSYSPPMRPAVPVRIDKTIEPKLRRKVARGRIEIDATIDLHGMRQAEARGALQRFIVARHNRGDRTVLVITGKGLKKTAADGSHIVERGVLRHMLPIWLGEPEFSRIIAGWDVAAQPHGGEGAFYVRLRPAD